MTQLESPLSHLMRQAQHSDGGEGASNLVILEQQNVAQIQIFARKDRSAILARRISSLLGIKTPLAPHEGGQDEGMQIYATGPLEYWVFSAKHSADKLEQLLTDALGDSASLFNQSHGRFVLQIKGRDATRLLAKGTSLDLNAGAFLSVAASHTTIEHIPALVVRRTSPVRFELSVPRSYANSLLSWLFEAAGEFGFSLNKSE